MTKRPLLLLGICAAAMGGCSSKPRNFAPVLTAAPADARAYEKHWLDCREQVAAATRKRSERLASAGGGAVAGAGAGLAASAAASGATFSTWGVMATAAAATIAVVPVVGLAGAWGISKIKKSKKERRIKDATAECMSRNGYSVEKWRVMSKQQVRALEAAQPDLDPAMPAGPTVTEPR